jgi:hypothetical protein
MALHFFLKANHDVKLFITYFINFLDNYAFIRKTPYRESSHFDFMSREKVVIDSKMGEFVKNSILFYKIMEILIPWDFHVMDQLQ